MKKSVGRPIVIIMIGKHKRSVTHFFKWNIRLDTMSLTAGGDWMCSACQHLNFKKRETCQLCGYPKYGGPDPATYICNATKVMAGDWYCTAINCHAHNYASRSSCYSCGTLKSGHAAGGYASDGSDPPGWKTGDWICKRWVHIVIAQISWYASGMIRSW